MCETIEKITSLSVPYIFLYFMNKKKYLKGIWFSLKMQYLNKQGQQASSKILKHPDEVITRWRSYTIWRYRYTTANISSVANQGCFLQVQKQIWLNW